MKRLKAFALTLLILLSLSACGEGATEQSSTENPDSSVTKTNIFFNSAGVYNYDDGADVPDYTVMPGLANVINKNQYQYGTDEVGDSYFALELSGEAANLIEQNGFVVIDLYNHQEYYSQSPA